jgi:hypothetical protein
MSDALKDCFLVFLAAGFAFLTIYYLANYRGGQRTVTQHQRQMASPTLVQQSSNRALP